MTLLTSLFTRCFATPLALLILFCFPLLAGADTYLNDLGGWHTATLTVPVSDRITNTTLFQLRMTDEYRQADRLFFFENVDYSLDKAHHLRVGAGVASYPSLNPKLPHESRTHQELVYIKPFKAGDLLLRERMEQRFMENESSVMHWNRSMVLFHYPLPKNTRYYINASEEFITQLNTVSSTNRSGFNNSRTSLLVGKSLTPHISVEAGYMLWWVNGRQDTLHHMLLTQVNFRLPAVKRAAKEKASLHPSTKG